MIYLADSAAGGAEQDQAVVEAKGTLNPDLQPASSLRRLSRQSTAGPAPGAAAGAATAAEASGGSGGVRQEARFHQGYDRLE